MKKIDLNNLAGGATAEQISREIANVLSNIKDPNTDQKAKRKLTITMTFVPDKGDSEIVDIHTVCKASLYLPMVQAPDSLLESEQMERWRLRSGVKLPWLGKHS